MDADEAYRALAQALRRSNDALAQKTRELADLGARFDHLIALLVGKGILAAGHETQLARVGEKAANAERPKVRLRVLVDKYRMPSSDVDCASLLPICHGRCCSLTFELTTQDLDEGVVRWEVEQPYVILHDRDGYCAHLDRPTRSCSIYEQRPAACRGFDCRGDARIWIDFERRIPAPMPAGMSPPRDV